MIKNRKVYLKVKEKEFITLLKMILIADYIVNGIREPDNEVKEYKKLYQTILKKAFNEGLSQYVEYSEEFKEFFPTKKFGDEGEVMEFIEDYNDDTFWEELKYKLFSKLYDKKYGTERGKGKIMAETILDDNKLFDFVEDEIYRNGLRNIHIRGEEKYGKEKKKY